MNYNFKDFLERFLTNSLTKNEQDELFRMMQLPESKAIIQQMLDEHLEEQSFADTEDLALKEVIYRELENKINTVPNYGKVIELPPAKRSFSLNRKAVAAAAIIFLFAAAGYFLIFNKSTKQVAKNEKQTPLIENDVSPGGNKAVLTLADGSKITLDSAANGTLAEQGNTTVLKLNAGEVVYNSDLPITNSGLIYNTISTPRGGQYQVVLSDGSKVWLNAASSLRFPTAFIGNERTVELTGEGYFEVAHNPNQPFSVKVNDMHVTVLGTHFNINSYSDEPTVKTTLLEGRVRVDKDDQHVYLNRGHQAILEHGEKNLTVAYDVDVEEVVAWKNGYFLFNSDKIQTVMRQVARWYDVEVKYKGKITDEDFVGIVSRSGNVSEVLKMMETTRKLKFEIGGKTIVVSSP